MNDIDNKRQQKRRELELVMFPASKNFPLESEVSEQLDALGKKPQSYKNLGDDPLEDLLNEFSDYEDAFEQRPEPPGHEDLELLNLELRQRLGPMPDFEVLLEQLQLLKETQSRLKVYLDEIDSVLPTR